jgi:hypothetical protein
MISFWHLGFWAMTLWELVSFTIGWHMTHCIFCGFVESIHLTYFSLSSKKAQTEEKRWWGTQKILFVSRIAYWTCHWTSSSTTIFFSISYVVGSTIFVMSCIDFVVTLIHPHQHAQNNQGHHHLHKL